MLIYFTDIGGSCSIIVDPCHIDEIDLSVYDNVDYGFNDEYRLDDVVNPELIQELCLTIPGDVESDLGEEPCLTVTGITVGDKVDPALIVGRGEPELGIVAGRDVDLGVTEEIALTVCSDVDPGFTDGSGIIVCSEVDLGLNDDSGLIVGGNVGSDLIDCCDV